MNLTGDMLGLNIIHCLYCTTYIYDLQQFNEKRMTLAVLDTIGRKGE